MSSAEAELVALAARSVVARSALHAALILTAITSRKRFGLGELSTDRRDLLAMEGSVWRTPGYPDLVRRYWQAIAGEELRVELTAEKSFSASDWGPLYLTVLHQESIEEVS